MFLIEGRIPALFSAIMNKTIQYDLSPPSRMKIIPDAEEGSFSI